MKNGNNGKTKETEVVRKPFLTGSVTDERTLKSSLAFFGVLIVVIFITLIACATATFDIVILRVLLNAAVIIVCLMIFYNKGAGYGSEAVSHGEILYQKKEKGQQVAESERKLCYHPAKGYVTGLIGTLPLLIPALILAVTTSVQMTGAGALPSWMQAYTGRSDIGNALINYTQPEGMKAVDYIRTVIRICILPYINIIGNANKTGVLFLERISPLIMLLPATVYGTGYRTGKKIRTRIHTVISENDRKRVRREKKRIRDRNTTRAKGPEQLN